MDILSGLEILQASRSLIYELEKWSSTTEVKHYFVIIKTSI